MRIEFPDDMREYAARRGRYFRGYLRALLYFALLFAGLGVCLLAIAPPRLQTIHVWCAATVLYTAFLGFGMYRNLQSSKFYDQPCRLAFDETYAYVSTPLLEQRFRWEYCNGWSETRRDIVLRIGSSRVRWPKEIWTPEELEAIRRNLRTHARPEKKQPKAPKTETS